MYSREHNILICLNIVYIITCMCCTALSYFNMCSICVSVIPHKCFKIIPKIETHVHIIFSFSGYSPIYAKNSLIKCTLDANVSSFHFSHCPPSCSRHRLSAQINSSSVSFLKRGGFSGKSTQPHITIYNKPRHKVSYEDWAKESGRRREGFQGRPRVRDMPISTVRSSIETLKLTTIAYLQRT